MKKGFVRGLWGNSPKVKAEIDSAIQRDISRGLDFVCYTFGEDNHNLLLSKNIKSILVEKKPSIYNERKHTWRYKLDVYKFAMQDLDEMVYLDWDCNLVCNLNENFWTDLSKKEPIQGCLYRWKRAVALWRKLRWDQSYIINNGFLYMRDKTIPQNLIDEWNKRQTRNDEEITAFHIDKMTGEWKGESFWREHFEPESCQLLLNPVFQKPNHVFKHF
jgi:hypothetical protein